MNAAALCLISIIIIWSCRAPLCVFFPPALPSAKDRVDIAQLSFPHILDTGVDSQPLGLFSMLQHL